MGKLTKFTICLKNENGVCYAGEVLEGVIAFTCSGKFKIKGKVKRFYIFSEIFFQSVIDLVLLKELYY